MTTEQEVYAGQVMILAGAGAGKTKTFVHRTANLIRIGTDPRHILCVTFTNRAARELRQSRQVWV